MKGFKLNNKHLRTRGLILLILFSGYFASTNFFSHSHIVDGITIVHSHPYKSDSGNNPVNHDHSKNSLHLINYISDISVLVSVFFSGIAFLLFSEAINKNPEEDSPVLSPHYIFSGRPRAPSH